MSTSSSSRERVERVLALVTALACLVSAWQWGRDAIWMATYEGAVFLTFAWDMNSNLAMICAGLAVTLLPVLAARSFWLHAWLRAVAQLVAFAAVLVANAFSPASLFAFFPGGERLSSDWYEDIMRQLFVSSAIFVAVALACLWWAWSPTLRVQSSGKEIDQSEPSASSAALS